MILFDFLFIKIDISSRQITDKDEYITLLRENSTNVRKLFTFIEFI
jgi:hypothetical protein